MNAEISSKMADLAELEGPCGDLVRKVASSQLIDIHTLKIAKSDLEAISEKRIREFQLSVFSFELSVFILEVFTSQNKESNMQNYKELKVWEKGHALTLEIYKATRSFPAEELYALTSQMRRAAYSIPTNIAEGCGRRGKKELVHFCDIAIGSSNELEYQILLAKDLKYIGEERFTSLTNSAIEIRKMLYSFVKKLTTEN